jgi:hypothetical protein
MTQQQFDSLVEAISNSVTEKFKAEHSLRTCSRRCASGRGIEVGKAPPPRSSKLPKEGPDGLRFS